MKHIGFLDGIYDRGVSIPPGGVVELSDRSAAHYLTRKGAVDLTPTPIADAIIIAFGLIREEPLSPLRFTDCPGCQGKPRMTLCPICAGNRRVMTT